MKTLKIILLIFIILLVILTCAILWLLYYPKSEDTNRSLRGFVVSSQANYFCKLAYPQLAGCVNFELEACPSIVKEYITPCIEQAINELANGTTKVSVNQAIGQCVDKNLQLELLDKHFNNTPECRAKI